MKFLVVLFAMLCGSAAFADVSVRYDSIYFQRNTAWVSANRVCQHAGNLYATVKFDVCQGPNDSNCGLQEFRMVQPMRSTTVRCASNGRECKAYQTYPLNQGGTVYKYSYNSIIEAAEEMNAKVTPYRIRNCQ